MVGWLKDELFRIAFLIVWCKVEPQKLNRKVYVSITGRWHKIFHADRLVLVVLKLNWLWLDRLTVRIRVVFGF